MSSATVIAIRDEDAAAATDGFYSPAKQKAANRGAYGGRPVLRRVKQAVSAAKVKLFLALCVVSIVVLLTSRLSSFMGWNLHHPSSVSAHSRGGYTVLINSWKQNSLLKQGVAHYASCRSVDAIHVAWSEREPPSDALKTHLNNIVFLKSRRADKPNFRFGIAAGDNLSSRFRPIEDLETDAIFSVDDDVIVPCSALDFAFSVWQSAPLTMVGFVPRMHWLDKEIGILWEKLYGHVGRVPLNTKLNIEQNNVAEYRYGGWWSVWWMGTYSMVLSKAAFFHRKYLDLYTYNMSSSIKHYVSLERNCEDIAMSLLVANATGAPPIWVKGKIYEIGASAISSLRGHGNLRNKCLNDLISLYGTLPLVPTNFKAVSARNEWLW